MRYFPYLVCLPIVLVGIGVAVLGVRTIRKANLSANWPTTDGSILKSEIACAEGRYEPMVVYRYAVDGKPHQGTEIGFGNRISSSDSRHATSYSDKYQVGALVTVYYDPENPNTAVLEPGVTKKTYITITFGLGFAIIGTWFGLIAWLFD
jgi:hypothetical protein